MTTAARMISLADGVVTLLNAGEFSTQFKAERGYVPELTADVLKNLKVLVIPGGYTGEFATRGKARMENRIVDVGVFKHLASQDTEEADELMLLVDEIDARLVGEPGDDNNVITVGNLAHTLIKVENTAIFLPEQLRAERIFGSVLRLTYRVGRAA